MTNTNTETSSAKLDPPLSINDNLPTSNPPLWVVLPVLGCIALFILVLTFHSWLGF
jgi:hypothetical protein